VEDRSDVRLFQAGADLLADDGEDLFRLIDRGSDALDLEGRLATSQRADERARRHESIGVGGALERLAQHEPEPVREPVGRRVARRVVDCDRLRVEALDGFAEGGAHALVVCLDFGVGADRFEAGRVEAPDDRDPLARTGKQERALPREVGADDELDARVGCDLRLVNEREPEIDAVLLEDRRRLVEFLADEGRVVGHAVEAFTFTDYPCAAAYSSATLFGTVNAHASSTSSRISFASILSRRTSTQW
jgi:hypothetical protein